jgi:Copper amine oxidase, enzyme domain
MTCRHRSRTRAGISDNVSCRSVLPSSGVSVRRDSADVEVGRNKDSGRRRRNHYPAARRRQAHLECAVSLRLDAATDGPLNRLVVESADRTNRYGEPTAYRLSLPNTTRSFGRPDSVMARRAPFIHQHLWATRADPAEQFIGGQYPNHAVPGEDGVHVWQRQNRSLDGAEIVLWPLLGTHHFARPEQWPVMPVDTIGFVYEPDGFFDRNPALDVPAPQAAADSSSGCAAD